MPWFDLFVLLAVIMLNGFFALAEMALVSARAARLKALSAESGETPGIKAALQLASDPSRMLSVVQIGITLVSVFAGAYSGARLAEPLGHFLNGLPFIAPHGEAIGLAVVVVCLTIVTLIFGELVPKRLAMAHAERIAVAVARPMQGIAFIGAPVVWALKEITDTLSRLFGVGEKQLPAVSEEEIKHMIAEGTESGVFAPQEQRMIEGVLRLPDRAVRTIMTPRPDMVSLDLEASAEETLGVLLTSGYSRYPVARGVNGEEIVGVVSAKVLLDEALKGKPLNLRTGMRRPLFVLDSTPAMRLLELFRHSGEALAIVLDEYGSVEGLVSANDILVAIAGALPDAGEVEEGKPVQRADGSWLLDGMMPIEDVEGVLKLRGLAAEAEFQTLAGFMLAQFRHLPKTGESFVFRNVRFEVMDLDGRRIDKVLAEILRTSDAEDSAAADRV